MLEMGRRTLGDRIEWVEADLRRADWSRALGGRAFDAVVSATALHWLDADHVAHGMAGVMRPGGVFLDFDAAGP